MSAESKKYGVSGIGSTVELGKAGPKAKNSSGVVEFRNNADNAYAIVRGDTPVADNDLATKAYVDKKAGMIVSGQINGGSPPAAGTLGRVFVVTTTGGAYTEKELWRDNGSAWEKLTLTDGMTVGIADALTGGNIEFLANHVYQYDEDTATWKDIGPSSATTSTMKSKWITITYTNTGANAICTVPANAQVVRAKVRVTQAFNGTSPSLIIGDAGDTDRHMEAIHVDLTTVGLYEVDLLYLYGSSTAVNATLAVTGSPSTGQCTVELEYGESA